MKILVTEQQKLILEGIKIQDQKDTSNRTYNWYSLYKKAVRRGLEVVYKKHLKLIKVNDKSELPTDREIYFVKPGYSEKWNDVADNIIKKLHLYDEYVTAICYEQSKMFIDQLDTDMNSYKSSSIQDFSTKPKELDE